MLYDGDGKRLERQTPSQSRLFVYDFDKVLQEADGSGATQKQYASTEEQYGDLLSAYGGGQASYYAFDGLGSADALLAPDGTATDRYAYRAFGLNSHYQGSSDNRYDWVGKQGYYDDRESGLYFLRERFYDPQAGRFVSQDPLGFEAGDANLYRYTFNDPVNQIDPSGKAVLVGLCTNKSEIADLLTTQIRQETGSTVAGIAIEDKAFRRNILGYPYFRLDLLDAVSVSAWRALGHSNSKATTSGLSSHLNEAIKDTDYILSTTRTWPWSSPQSLRKNPLRKMRGEPQGEREGAVDEITESLRARRSGDPRCYRSVLPLGEGPSLCG